MMKIIYADGIAVLLLLSAACHIFFPSQTSHWMSKPVAVRFVGGCLLLLSIPCLWWRGWYFWTLFIALVVSGAWRFWFPQHSIHAQGKVIPAGCMDAFCWAQR
jgi:hypothetical protein